MSSTQAMDTWITCGQFGRAHGIRGDVRLWVHNPKSKLLKPGCHISVTAAQPHGIKQDVSPVAPQKSYRLKHMRKDAKGLIVSLDGIQSREDAISLNHCLWVIQRKDFGRLANDEFYFADLIGAEGVLDDDRSIGALESFIEAGAGVVLVFNGDHGEVMVPYVDAFVTGLDLENKKIHIKSIPGLLEGGV